MYAFSTSDVTGYTGHHVEVFYDENQDGVWNSGEQGRSSEYFIVKALTTPTLSVGVSTVIPEFSAPGMTQAQLHALVDSVITDSFNMALSRDSAGDNRALIRPVVGTVTQFTPTADPVADTDAARQAQLDANYADIAFFDELMGVRGEADDIPGSHMIVDWDDQYPETVVHEYGHIRGLFHDSANDPNNIMCRGDFPRNRGANLLRADQADNYE